MLTPVFHPNFDDSTVCIGDFWAASEGLDDLIIRIGRMISYQEYNTKSPLNGLAAKWAEQHTKLFPIDPRNMAPPLEKRISAVDAPSPTTEAAANPETAALASSSAHSQEAAAQDPWPEQIRIE
jgi:hypothetical protein